MKQWFFCFLFTASLLASTERSSTLPQTKLPKARFREIIRLFVTEFQSMAAKDGRKFEILSDYDDDWGQAFARRWETDQILVFGGAVAIRNGTEDTFALLLCHETGHLYGGRPWIDDTNKLSLEGQADYWSAECFRKIAPKLSPWKEERLVSAAVTLSAFYAEDARQTAPSPDTPDLTVRETTLKTHPDPQCRLDTILAGMKGLPRPRCWYGVTAESAR